LRKTEAEGAFLLCWFTAQG